MLDKTAVQNSDIPEILSASEKLSHPSTAAIRGIESGKDVLVMFGFKLKEKSRSGITCNLRRASNGSRSVRKRFVGHLSTLMSIHTSVVRRHNEQCSQKRKFNIFHAYMFCATKDSSGHTVKFGRSPDAHKRPTRNVSEQL